ncbi:MAG: tetratricopeptide repeat protein [Anaerolineaceae bacterium]|nr:tetratricopeptide repeat protein [Anaerolineaceae bacterium]
MSIIKKAILWMIITNLLLISCGPIVLPDEIRLTSPSTETPNIPTPTLPPLVPPATQTPVQQTIKQERTRPNVDEAEWLIYLGDLVAAEATYQNRYQTEYLSNEEYANALVGLGQIAHAKGDRAIAISTLESVIEQYSTTLAVSKAYYFLAQIYDEIDNPAKAAQLYQHYLRANQGVLDAYIGELLANAFFDAGDYQSAVDTYLELLPTFVTLTDQNRIKIKIGQTYESLTQYDIAIQYYQEVLNSGENDYISAQMNLFIGRIYITLGLPEQAFIHYQDNVNRFPFTYDAYSCLVALVEADQTVDELNRGLIDYNVGYYGLAVDAFNRYIESTTVETRNPAAYHYKALSLVQLEQYDEAIAAWEIVAEQYGQSDYWSKAHDEIAYTQWAYLGDLTLGAETYVNYVDNYYYTDSAPDFLYWAARIYERADELELAAENWTRVMESYPEYEDAFRALQLAGVSYYRLENYPQAENTFNRLLIFAANPAEQAAAHFWLGKTHEKMGQTQDAIADFESAQRVSPDTYYGIRANDLLNARPPLAASDTVDLGIDEAREQQQADTWMRSVFDLDGNTNFDGAVVFADNTHYLRAQTFWSLGLYDRALAEFETLRLEAWDNPVDLYRLLDSFIAYGFYRSAIVSSRRILDLAFVDAENLNVVPAYFNHIRYGAYFQDDVLENSSRYQFDPLLIYSLIRQESLFDSQIGSSAGAMGLMQIIPSTGETIAAYAAWPPDYETEDLWLPKVNIRLGITYLDRQRKYFDGNLYPALAAYNAGPGNASTWLDLSKGDMDLFYEIIRFGETRTYLQYITELYYIYQTLYERAQ